VKYDNIRRARLNKKKILIKISEYATRNTELDKVEADILTIDLEEQERAMLGALREFETLYSIWQSFPKKYTREDIDKNQADYWQKRLSRQAQQDIQATGRVGAGNSEALRQIEMENILKPKIASNVNMINKKEFHPHMLPYMQCKDIFPERWKEIDERNQLRLKAAYEIKLVPMSDMIKCSRCKSKKVSYYELQTRSGDEASTLFMNCLICGKKWKQ
jgi:DNA-directed RNA polymerase subunit M/transcription elongation factor TFIIS